MGDLITDYIVGLELGKADGYSTLAVVSRVALHQDPESPYDICHLRRFSPGTPLTDITAEIFGLLLWLPIMEWSPIVVDVTGAGRAIIDLLKFKGVWPYSVTVVPGTAETGDTSDYKIPKWSLVSIIQMLLRSKRIVITRSFPEINSLATGLREFKREYGTWRVSPYDDVVLAVAMATWFGERKLRQGGWEWHALGWGLQNQSGDNRNIH